MKIEVEMREGSQEMDIEEGATGEELLKKLGFTPDEVLLIVDNRPIPYNEKLREGKIKIIRVVSGG